MSDEPTDAGWQAGCVGAPASADVIHIYVVEYEQGHTRYQTCVEARDIESAKHQFRRDNPDVEMLSCV